MSLAAAFWLPSRDSLADAQPRTVDLRALTVKQPWAACIASGRKPVENRTWPTRYRGWLAIHAGAAQDGALALHAPFVRHAYGLAPGPSCARSAIVAVALLTDCHEYRPGCCATPWAEKGAGVWHWALADVQALSEPVECAGRLSLWRPADEVRAAVMAQLGGA